MANEKGIVREMTEAVNDKEHSIGERSPGSPFAIVALSYLTILAVACMVIGITLWMIRT